MAAHFYTTKDKANGYDALIEPFNGLFRELKDLGKKKPDAALSAAKVKMLNRILQDVIVLLDGEQGHKYLDLLDDETLPQYSDAVLVMAQFEGALQAFHSRHHGYQSAYHENRWFIQDTEGAKK
jgi:hypothetical protein